MTIVPAIILASGSSIRAEILRCAGLSFQTVKSGVDEETIKDAGLAAGKTLEQIAMSLAEAKALAITCDDQALVVGSDQILEFEGQAFDKPNDMKEARARLLMMAGKTHSLINATAAVRNGKIIWRHLERPKLTLRKMSGKEIDKYLALAGEAVLSSVAAYQIERFGAALFDDIEGDWFAILGLAISPLLKFLAQEGAVSAVRAAKPLRLAGVVGTPISHSLSPVIHRFWAARESVNGFYTSIEAAADETSFRQTIDILRKANFRGVNVTVPHKEHALRYAASASAGAKMAGAANMLTFDNEHVAADNSDIAGFFSAVKSVAELPKDARALMLGAGGGARGVALALEQLGAAQIIVANRTREKSEALSLLSDKIEVVDWESRQDVVAAADIIVNTTSLGMTGSPPLQLSLENAKSSAIVADIVYSPLETPLLRVARERGMQRVDGLSMLMAQAAPGYQQWLGDTAIVDDALRDAVKIEIAKRRPNMKIIGLTGSIGMGKSTVAAMFADLGGWVWNADDAVHRLYGPNGDALESISEIFPNVVDDTGVNRSTLARVVLKDAEKLRALEAIVHPLVARDREQFLKDAAAAGAKLVVLDIPLLFENNYETGFDAVIVVSASEIAQKKRVLARPGMTEEKLAAILAQQTPDEEKRARADFVISTDKPIEETRRDVIALFDVLMDSPDRGQQ